MKRIEKLENRGDAKGMPLTVKGRRVSKDYLIENGIIEDWGVAKKDYTDTVSRQAAIDAIDEYNAWGYVDESFETLEKALLELPSARPEVIKCEDCEYSEEWHKDKKAWCVLRRDVVFKGDFCSYAERVING